MKIKYNSVDKSLVNVNPDEIEEIFNKKLINFALSSSKKYK